MRFAGFAALAFLVFVPSAMASSQRSPDPEAIAAAADDRPELEDTLAQLNSVQDETLAQVFQK